MDYEHFMQKALDQARDALKAGEFPVGCVMVYKNRILASAARSGTAGDTANEIDHAEMVALRRFVDLKEKIDARKVALFCTMEPCLMCLGAIILNGIGEVVYAYEDVMGGAASYIFYAGKAWNFLGPISRTRKIHTGRVACLLSIHSACKCSIFRLDVLYFKEKELIFYLVAFFSCIY